MRKIVKRLLFALLAFGALSIICLFLILQGHFAFRPVPAFLIEGTQVNKCKWHVYGFTDTTYLLRIDISDGQLNKILEKYELGKAELTQQRFKNFLNASPYWWNMNWSDRIEFYHAEKNIDGFYATAIVDLELKYLLLRFWDT